MNYRRYLVAFTLVALLSASQSLRAAGAAATSARRPNVVIILADDMGFSDIGCYGGEIETPNLDRLAAGGVRFTQFYNTSRCCPTRAALLTGLYPHQAGVGHMTTPDGKLPGYQGNLSHDALTIAEALKPAGYATYMCGKWHVTREDKARSPKTNWPRARGFDRYYGMIRGGGSYFDPPVLVRDELLITPQSDPEYHPDHFYFTDAIADQSVRFIREHREQHPDQPFFLYTAFTSPHWPLHAPSEAIAKYKGRYDGGYEPVRAARFARMKQLGIIDPHWELSPPAADWADVQNKPWEARCMEVYAAQVDRMDQNIGKIVAALTAAGQLDNTLVLFLSDNGGCAEPMGRDTHAERAAATTIPAMRPDELELQTFPLHTRGGKPVLDGQAVMPGGEDSFIAYGRAWANVSNTPFREYKHFVHEGGISTPLIAHWPAGISRRGDFERQPGHVVDLMATCVDLAGATYPKEINGQPSTPLQGASLLPAFAAKPLTRPRPIFFEHEGNRAVRDGKWKLVAKGAAGAWELYDMDADRTEMHDLAAAEPEKVKQMSAAWEQWAKQSKVLPLTPWARKPANPAAAPAE